MKRIQLFLIIFVTMAVISQSFGQNIIDSQQDLTGGLGGDYGPNGLCGFIGGAPGAGLTDDFAGLDWIFAPGMGNELTIPAGRVLGMNEGVDIEFAPDFLLTVWGMVESRDANLDGQFALTTIGRIPGQNAWATIRVIDDGQGAGGNGVVTLNHCEISGGGSAVWDDGDADHDWRGMIFLQHTAQNQHPELFLTECELHSSETNGITVTVPS